MFFGGTVTTLVGAIGVALAFMWASPFSYILAAWSTSCASFWLYSWLHLERSWLGVLSRMSIWLPGTLLAVGIGRMWLWATT